MKNKYIISGAFFMLLGVVLGAFGAHALKESLGNYGLEIWKTAVLYQFLHALALLVLANFTVSIDVRWSRLIFILFNLGIILFSGSLYVLALTDNEMIQSICGPLTPIGGLFMIASWAFVIFVFIKK